MTASFVPHHINGREKSVQKSHKNGNRRLVTRVAVIAGTAGAVLAFAAPMASAQDPVDNSVPGAAVCPATAESCVSVVVQSGTFDNNGFNLPIGKGDMIIAAEAGSGEGESTVLLPRDDGHNGVYSKPLTVPGGVLGIDLPFGNLFGLAAVTAEVEATAAPTLNGIITDMDLSIPVRMKINNAFLGDNCYLGSAAAPVNLRLAPDPSVVPTYTVLPSTALKVSPVGNEATGFALPAASGCGPFGVLSPTAMASTSMPVWVLTKMTVFPSTPDTRILWPYGRSSTTGPLTIPDTVTRRPSLPSPIALRGSRAGLIWVVVPITSTVVGRTTSRPSWSARTPVT